MLGFLLLNTIASFHAYKFTHFSTADGSRTKTPEKLTSFEKLSAAFFGISNPRPQNEAVPQQPFQTVSISGSPRLECWKINVENPIGTVILFHGFSASKSSLLLESDFFHQKQFNVVLVDFVGSGGSEGNETSIGYFEADQVYRVYENVRTEGATNVFLFGTSMGAVAIMRAIDLYNIRPSGVMLECPFGSMYQTVGARFDLMNMPSFPMAGLLVFWGGVLNGFWAFSHNPYKYAKSIDCPTLLLWGEKDLKVSREETEKIFEGLAGRKELATLNEAGHENLMRASPAKWQLAVEQFLTP